MNKYSNITKIIVATIIIIGVLIASYEISDAIIYLADTISAKLDYLIRIIN